MRQGSRRTICVLLAGLALLAGCQGVRKGGGRHVLTRQEALQLAVTLANERCQAQFSTSPFDTTSYGIEFDEGRWRWGHLDPMGCGGFSAVVSFDRFGENESVEACFSTDAAFPRETPDLHEQR